MGFAREPEKYLRQSTVHVFPSQCEGSAKVTYEAAACGLPQITTREAGDVVEDGVQGIIVPPADVDALAAAIQQLYDHPEIVERMSLAARERVVENFTWDHFRARLLDAYELAMRSGGMTNSVMPNDEGRMNLPLFRHSNLGIDSSFGIRNSSFPI